MSALTSPVAGAPLLLPGEFWSSWPAQMGSFPSRGRYCGASHCQMVLTVHLIHPRFSHYKITMTSVLSFSCLPWSRDIETHVINVITVTCTNHNGRSPSGACLRKITEDSSGRGHDIELRLERQAEAMGLKGDCNRLSKEPHCILSITAT